MSTGKTLPVAPGMGFTNVYTLANIPLGTKLLIQNISSSPLFVCLYSTAQEQGFVLQPYEHYVVPANAEGCFVKTTTGYGGVIAVEPGAWNVIGGNLDERVYTGLKGLTVQPFIEANVKNGSQWEVSFENNSLASSAYSDTILTTGSEYVLVKSRLLSFTGSEIEASVYKNPTFTGGSVLTIYNLNTETGGTPLAVMKTGATVSNVGTEVAAKSHAYGTDTNVQQAVGTYNVNGLERVLQPNTSYLLRIQNQATTTIKLAGYITFYEGEISSLN